jgi:hypothetical protein
MTDQRVLQALRYLGAAALLGVGIVHLQQYDGAHYSAIPTIGTLFLLNFVSAALVAAGLFAPVQRLFPRLHKQILGGLAAAGIGIALGALVALLISEQTPLFGFMEGGYRQAIVIAIGFEIATMVLLAAFLAGVLRGERAARSPSGGHVTSYR